jgi:hypothetical protein
MGSSTFINQEILEIIVNSFKKCCTSNRVDVADDDMLWNGNKEDGNVRSD